MRTGCGSSGSCQADSPNFAGVAGQQDDLRESPCRDISTLNDSLWWDSRLTVWSRPGRFSCHSPALPSVLNRRAMIRLRGRVGIYVAGGAALLAFCALAVLDAERSSPNANISDFGDAIWWPPPRRPRLVTVITTLALLPDAWS